MNARLGKRKFFIFVAVSSMLMASCASAPPMTAPDYSANSPVISKGFHIENREVIEIEIPRSQFLLWREQANLSEILTATEGMAGVKNTVILSGGKWGDKGDLRRIELEDGHYAVETILDSTDERLYYQVWGFTSQAGQFADYATGEFRYHEQGDTTKVIWTYRFRPNSLFARLPLGIFVNNRFQGFMETGLANMKLAAEKESQ